MRISVVLLTSSLIALSLSAACKGTSTNGAVGTAAATAVGTQAATAVGTATTDPTPISRTASPTATAKATATATATATAGGAAADLCSLLSATQASSINNVTYGTATPQHVQSGYDICTYTNTGQHPDPIDIQDLTVTVISSPGCYQQLQSADGPGTSIAGLGDAAFGYEIGIDVSSGGKCVTIQGLTHAEFKGNYGPDTAMAKIIIAGLH